MKKRKLNWLDITIILILITVLLFLFSPTKSNDTENELFGVREVEFQVEVLDSSYDIYKSITLDEFIISQGSVQKTQITDKKQYATSALITLKGSANYRGPFMTIGGQIIKIGKEFYIKTEMLELKGRIIQLEYGGQL